MVRAYLSLFFYLFPFWHVPDLPHGLSLQVRSKEMISEFFGHIPRFTSHCKYANGRGILLTCAVDTDHKKASRQPHLPASMLNSSLVLSAITCKAEGMHSPYVTLGRMQSAQTSEKESASEREEVCVRWLSIFYLTHLYSMCICVSSLFFLCLWSL